jgi:hypothetical protein
MKHVVERCPSCGVEHEAPGDGRCEACGEALRPWCRRHGRDIGWLRDPACPRCAEEAARPAPPPRPPARPAPVRASVQARPKAPARPAPRKPPAPPTSWPGGRSPREILRGPRARIEPEDKARGMRAVAVLVRLTLGGTLGGALGGWIAGTFAGDPAETAWFLGFMLGFGGLVVGLVYAAAVLFQDRPG